MIGTVLPSVRCGGLSKILLLIRQFWFVASCMLVPEQLFATSLRSARFFLRSFQQHPAVFDELISALSKCSQAEEKDTERCWASPEGESCQGLCVPLNARYLRTSLGRSHHQQICFVKNRICSLALASAFPCCGWIVVWAGRSSWHSQAPYVSSPLAFWSLGCSKWTAFVWIRGSKRFCSIPGCKGLSLQDAAVFILS